MIRHPMGWQLVYRRCSNEATIGHPGLWEHELAQLIAQQWSKPLGKRAKALDSELVLLTYAFPRGRVTKVGAKHVVYHGKDLQSFMGITRRQIETAFGIVGRCRWEFDEHERCQMPDKEEMRSLLKLREDWPAV